MIFGIQVTTGHYGVGMDYFIFIGLFGHGLLAEKMLRDNFVCGLGNTCGSGVKSRAYFKISIKG